MTSNDQICKKQQQKHGKIWKNIEKHGALPEPVRRVLRNLLIDIPIARVTSPMCISSIYHQDIKERVKSQAKIFEASMKLFMNSYINQKYDIRSNSRSEGKGFLATTILFFSSAKT